MTRGARHMGPGFTLVEAIVTMVVISTLGAVASGLLFSGLTAYRDSDARARLSQEASVAMERVCAELRGCPLDAGAGEVAPLITGVTATSINWNGCSLALSGDELLLSEGGGAAAPLLTDVSALEIQCYDESDAPLAASLSGTDTHPIRRVSITMSVSRQGVTETIRTRVFIRSTMLGAAS